MKCTNCGEFNASGRARCGKCGKPLPDAGAETMVDADDLTSDDLRSPREAKTARKVQMSRTRRGSAEARTENAARGQRGGTSGSGSFGSMSGSGSRARSSTGILAPSTIFGNRYEILELVGEGGMGQVYKVLD